MELTYATIVVLASMIFVLSGMIGYLYWQQTRMMQHLNSIAIVVSTHFAPRELQQEEEEEEEPVKQEETEEEEEDDRVSVKDEVEHVEGPKDESKPEVKQEAEEDIDDLQDKTAAQLRDLLTKKGIPFGKRDPKTVLIQLLKATA
jgi:hypothetical protein